MTSKRRVYLRRSSSVSFCPSSAIMSGLLGCVCTDFNTAASCFDSRLAKNSANSFFHKRRRKTTADRTAEFEILSLVPFISFAKSLVDLCVNGVLLLIAVINHLCYSFLCICGPVAANIVRSCQFSLGVYVVLLYPQLIQLSDACSTRPSPKPRPPRPYWRVDEKSERTNCTPDYQALYCLNNGTCFMQNNIHNVPTAYCECYGYYGRRCEYLDVADRHLPSQQRQKIETAAISVAVTLLIMIAFILSVTVYVYRRRMKYPRTVFDATDRPFSIRPRDQSAAVRRPRRLEDVESGAGGFDPSSSGAFDFIDSDRKATAVGGRQETRAIGTGTSADVHIQRAEIHRPVASAV